MKTKYFLTLTFTGREKLTPQQIWEFIDNTLQDSQIEIDGEDYFIQVEKQPNTSIKHEEIKSNP